MATRKALIHRSKGCNGVYGVLYTEGNLPYLKCEQCGHEMKDWVKWNEEYRFFYKDEAKWTQKKDHMMCILGYFCSLYEKHFEDTFSLSLDEKGLFNSAEHNILRRVYNNFEGDAAQTREYLEWYFQEKVDRRKKKITSLSFLATPAALNEYKLHKKKQTIITRDRLIPPKMLEWISQFAPKVYDAVSLKDYGDLHNLLSAYRQGHYHTEDMNMFVGKLNSIGLIDEEHRIKNWRE